MATSTSASTGVPPQPGVRHGGGGERLHPAAQLRRQHLLQLGQRAHGRLLDAGDRAARGGAQPDRDGDRLLVVEQQRRQLRAGLTAGSRRRRPRVVSTG